MKIHRDIRCKTGDKAQLSSCEQVKAVAECATYKTFSVPSQELKPVLSYTVLTELSWFLKWDYDIKWILEK
jgi:hypothetical protein